MGLSMNLFAGNYAKWKKRGEEVVRESGLDYTIVRPTWLTDSDDSLNGVEVSQVRTPTHSIPFFVVRGLSFDHARRATPSR